MENDKVVLDLEKYNELRDFKRNIEEGKIVEINSGFYSYSIKYLNSNEAFNSIEHFNNMLKEKIDELNKENRAKEELIKSIQQMSVWEFIEWRKSFKK